MLCCAVGCEPKLAVGTWPCSGSGGDGNESDADAAAGAAGAANGPDANTPIPLPWTLGFEDGFCGYTDAMGFCYLNQKASYELVTSPVHSGRFAAAFNVASDSDGAQTRCVRHGSLPTAAYYGAWYYLPENLSSGDDWNLIHFQGGSDPASQLHGLWDVSLASQTDGTLELFAFDFLHGTRRATNNVPAVPTRSWFHIEVYLKRAADDTGEFALYQNGALAIHLTNLATDDSAYGQWYLGNLALTPPSTNATFYVDDVSIRETR